MGYQPKQYTTITWFLDLVLIALSLGLFYAIFIGSYALFTPDEGRYSEVAREMLVNSDYITPRLNGIPFLDKPILYYWLQAASIQLFGLKEWSLRFWPAFFGVFGCMMVYTTGRILFTRRAGIISAVILAINPLYFATSHYANLDLEVGIWISQALLFSIIALQAHGSRKQTLFFILAYISAALAVLTKGLIGILFPMMIIGSWILILNRWHMIKKMHLLTGGLIFCAITVPWFILVQKANPQFFEFFFILQQFSRFLTQGDFNNQSVMGFYIPIVLIGMMPWTVFIFQALTYHLKNIVKNRRQHTTILFFMLWFILIFIFFSIPKSKTIGYILPIFPALALMIGTYLDIFWDRIKTKGISIGIISFVVVENILGMLFVAAPLFFSIDYKLTPYFIIMGMILSISGIVTYFLQKTNSFSKIFFFIAGTSALFLLIFIASADTLNHKSVKSLANILNKEMSQDDEVITYYRYYQDLPLYTGKRITIVADWHANDIAHYDNWQRELWYHMSYLDTSSWLIEQDTLWQRWQSDKRLFVIIHDNLYNKFIENLHQYAKTNPKVYHIGSTDFNNQETVFLISNKI